MLWLLYFYLVVSSYELAARRPLSHFPTLPPDPNQELPTLDALQQRFNANRSTWRVNFICAFLVPAMMYGLSLGNEGSPPMFQFSPNQLVATLLGAYIVGTLVGLRRYGRRWKALVAGRPELADCESTKGKRSPGYLAWILPQIVSAVVTLAAPGIGGIYAGFFALVGVSVYLRRSTWRHLREDQITPDPASPLGMAVQALMERCGLPSVRVVWYRSAAVGAHAMVDGSVTISRMLVHLMKEDELLAILAHELSHVRDRDAVALQRRARLVFFPFVTAVLALAIYGIENAHAGPFLFPIALSCFPLTRYLALPITSSYSHRLEFKCDAFATSLGFGPALISGLETLHRAIGTPRHLYGAHRLLSTHPSFAEREIAIRRLIELQEPAVS